jgi:hypothetical protein
VKLKTVLDGLLAAICRQQSLSDLHWQVFSSG